MYPKSDINVYLDNLHIFEKLDSRPGENKQDTDYYQQKGIIEGFYCPRVVLYTYF